MSRLTARTALRGPTMLALLTLTLSGCSREEGPSPLAEYEPTVRRIIQAVRTEGRQYQKLSALCDGIGPRLSGSEGDRASRDWAVTIMTEDGLENVRQEPVMVPNWVRGEEEGWLVGPVRRPLRLTTLGGSVGTPPEGIETEVVVVRDFAEFERLPADRVRGRMVLFDFPMRRTTEDMGGYSEAVAYRSRGPSTAAARGAVACLVRSVGTGVLTNPHTGVTSYIEGVPRIPAVALSMAEADALHRLASTGTTLRVHLRLGARTLPDVPGANVIGEIVGRERPEEVVVIGGHLDSWDLGTGAHDDGAGCIQAMEAARILLRLGLRPRRTIRVVLFASEESGGLRGGLGYAEAHMQEPHVAAIESDSGAGPLIGFSAGNTTREGQDLLREVIALLAPLGARQLRVGGSGGSDIGPLAQDGVPALGLWPDVSRYFDYHHSYEDVVSNVDPGLLADGTAAMAVMAWLLAELPEPLPQVDGGR
jgi:carboxypeptidase Q